MVLRVVVCGGVLVVCRVVLFLSFVCACDLLLFLRIHSSHRGVTSLKTRCSCRVFVRVTCFSSNVCTHRTGGRFR